MFKKILSILVIMLLVMAMLAPAALAADGTEAAADTPNFWEYIVEQAYVLIPVLYLMGMFIKKVPQIPDWLIPIILLVLGIVGGMALVGWTIYGVIQGVLVAGAAVFSNQLYKQISKANEDDDPG